MERKNIWSAILLFVLLTSYCSKAPQDKSIPSGLKDTHSAWFEGLLSEDTTIVSGVLSDDVTLGFPGGNVMPRTTFLAYLQSGDLFYDTAEHEDVRFRVYENAAVVTGRSNLAYRYKGNDGFERLTYTSVYVRTDGVWKMVAWQSTTRPE